MRIIILTLIAILAGYNAHANALKTKVKTTKVKDELFFSILNMPGECKSLVSKDYIASSSGIIDYVKTNNIAKKGELILAIDRSLSESQKEQAHSDYKAATLSFQRDKQLFAKKIISEEKLEQSKVTYFTTKSRYEEAQKMLDSKLIYAPFDGVISTIKFKNGDMVYAGDFLVNIVSGYQKAISFTVPERYVIDAENSEVTVIYKGNSYEAKNFEISKNISKNKSGYQGIVYVDDKNDLEHNSYVKLSINYDAQKGKSIPESSIIIESGKHFVYIVDPEFKAKKVEVELGIRSQNNIQIKSNEISLGTEVITEGIQKISSGQAVEIIN